MASFDMIILTKSSKYGAYCVAGICPQTGRFIRLITDDKDTHGALNFEDMIMDNGAIADVLDVIKVQDADFCPGPIQSENYIINKSQIFKYLGKATIDDVVEHFPVERRTDVFIGNHYKMNCDEALNAGHSIELLRVKNLRLYKVDVSGKIKTKASFLMGGVAHMDYAVTDPQYYSQDAMIIKDAYIVCSIADDDWARTNGFYKYVCAIYPI